MSIDCWVNTLSITVMAVAVIVPFLIGWQIYNYIKFESKMSKMVDKKIDDATNKALKSISEHTLEQKLELKYDMLKSYFSTKNMELIVKIIPSMIEGVIKTESRYKAESLIELLICIDEEAKRDISQLSDDVINEFRQSIRKLAQIDERAFVVLELIRDIKGRTDS